jgi:hypothetical protein
MMTLVGTHLRLIHLAALPHGTFTHPVFDELWELKGPEGTAQDMAILMEGGSRAAAFRRKVLAGHDKE